MNKPILPEIKALIKAAEDANLALGELLGASVYHRAGDISISALMHYEKKGRKANRALLAALEALPKNLRN